jgi:hypothetical protein
MTTELYPSWRQLFGSDSEPEGMETREFRVLHKRGEPFLYLPKMRVAARNALNLYPAQRTLARLARTAMNFSLCFGLPLPRTKVPLATNAPFAKFLKKLTNSGIMPEFSVLAGNPSAPGRRFIFLVFDSNGTPRWVVKAGAEDSAAALIEREADFLQRLPADLSGAPRVAARFVDGSAKAFAMDYADGDSPRDLEDGRIERTLSSWVDDSRELCPAELPVWRQLVDSDADPDLVAHLTTLLRNRTVHPVIAHGDFAPWNIKESRKAKSWVVLDWERGERDGMPGWDWFHFVTQSAILGRGQRTDEVARTVEELLSSPTFLHYAALTRIQGVERLLMLGYLLHHAHVIRPGEGRAETLALLEILQPGWNIFQEERGMPLSGAMV